MSEWTFLLIGLAIYGMVAFTVYGAVNDTLIAVMWPVTVIPITALLAIAITSIVGGFVSPAVKAIGWPFIWIGENALRPLLEWLLSCFEWIERKTHE